MDYAEIGKNRRKYESENTPDEELIAAVQRFPEREHAIAAQQVLVARQRAGVFQALHFAVHEQLWLTYKAMEPTATRRVFTSQMIKIASFQATRAHGSGGSSCSR